MFSRLSIIIHVFALALIFNNCQRYMEPYTPENVPLAIIETPKDGAIIKKSTAIKVRIENIEKIVKVVFYCNEDIIFEDMEEPYQANWNIVNVNDGNYQLHVKVIDESGFQVQSKPISVVVAKETTTFTLSLSSNGSAWEAAYIERTADYNYIVTGATLAAKIDDWGNVLFNTTFDWGYRGKGKCIKETADGGFIIIGDDIFTDAGDATSSGKFFLQKIDAYGNKIWFKEFKFRECNRASSVCLTNDNGFLITGATHNSNGSNGDIFILKTDADGNEMWRKLLGGQAQDWGYDILQTSDGDFMILGNTNSYGQGDYDIYMIRMDSAGEIVWSKTFGEVGTDFGRSIIQTADGNFMITGHTNNYNANPQDMFLLKIDNSGNELWHKTFGGDKAESAFSVIESEHGGFIMAGYTWSYGAGNSDIYVVKTDAGGELVWQNAYGGAGSEQGYCIENAFDGGYIISGAKSSNEVWILKIDAEGNI